jgi:magnesium chelatase subunit I
MKKHNPMREYYKLSTSEKLQIRTLGELKASGYRSESIKDELRRNLIRARMEGRPVFHGIWGYDETVIPDIERAILAKHHINLLGLRGQAKTRIARLMVGLLDEVIPVIAGSEINDDPLQPLSFYAREQVRNLGDNTPIDWLPREARYTEKLATPDVSVADLIGDIDPIKAAALKLSYADERVIHFGLVPRSHRCIFVMNELPDLQARIQVALFNILQEGDIQIRGFKMRLPLDIQFVFTANPEDYTNRGSIITPLKDRIDSQILTHYPKSRDIAKKITAQEVRLSKEQQEKVKVPELLRDLVEQVAFEARHSEYVDAKSGVSARLTISAYEHLVSSAERRCLLCKQSHTTARVADLWNIIPAITGKIELVYEGEQEGADSVARHLVGRAIRSLFKELFPEPEQIKKEKMPNPYGAVLEWFAKNDLELSAEDSEEQYRKKLQSVSGLQEAVRLFHKTLTGEEQLLMMEFLLHGLAEYSQISRKQLNAAHQFQDILNGMLGGVAPDDEEDEDGDFF